MQNARWIECVNVKWGDEDGMGGVESKLLRNGNYKELEEVLALYIVAVPF